MGQAAQLLTGLNFKNKKVFCIAPHPDDEVIGCGAFLLSLAQHNNIIIAYAVSGFYGVSDTYLTRHYGYDKGKISIDDKKLLRRQEAENCCRQLGATPKFWNLPFYDKPSKEVLDLDLNIVKNDLKIIKPDVIFVIDESGDPHGTHEIVQKICLHVFRSIKYSGIVLGYRVWMEYGAQDDLIVFEFDHMAMANKEKLLHNYQSQLQEPAFPHEEHSFMELMKLTNRNEAKRRRSSAKFAEIYRIIKI